MIYLQCCSSYCPTDSTDVCVCFVTLISPLSYWHEMNVYGVAVFGFR
jgi:hypothetical protein